jgi:hypothetical protein
MKVVFGILISCAVAAQAVAEEPLPCKPGAYGTPALEQPLPADPYAGYWGLSPNQLANRPELFQRNPPLPSSVPQPVLPTALNNMPNVPPFVSPAFEPRTTPQPGIIGSKSQR